MGNDVHWWKDRDEWMPPFGNDTPPRLDSDDQSSELETPVEDVGKVANDESFGEDPELPDRGPDH
jgi:hypothetical protein